MVDMKAQFITLEGCEGVGKSTQLRMLKEYFEQSGIPHVFTREPGGTPLAERIREILLDSSLEISPLVEAELFAAQRADHIDNLILPSLEKGITVVCDRYIDSSLAYQGEARGLGIDRVYELNAYARDNCMPDFTIFIDMDPANSWRKRSGKQIVDDRLEQESSDFHAKTYAGYKKMLEREPERIVAVVPDEDKNVTHQKIVAVLREHGVV